MDHSQHTLDLGAVTPRSHLISTLHTQAVIEDWLTRRAAMTQAQRDAAAATGARVNHALENRRAQQEILNGLDLGTGKAK